MAEHDRFDLERFVKAQAPVFETVLGELRAGRKRSHWMWFIFPQLRGLGHSPTAQFYGISSAEEARAYLAHGVLGSRLDQCTRIVLTSEAPSLHSLFGSPDDLKFRSCMTLFSHVADDPDNPFRQALERWCGGQPDQRTLELIDTAERRYALVRILRPCSRRPLRYSPMGRRPSRREGSRGHGPPVGQGIPDLPRPDLHPGLVQPG